MRGDPVTKTKFYAVWRNMHARCNNPYHKGYKRYGGRGITICQEWFNYDNFENDMYDEYGYIFELLETGQRNTVATLDRTNNDGNYCKDNCRWITIKEQQSNRKNPAIERWKNFVRKTPEEMREYHRIRQRKYHLIRKEKALALKNSV